MSSLPDLKMRLRESCTELTRLVELVNSVLAQESGTADLVQFRAHSVALAQHAKRLVQLLAASREHAGSRADELKGLAGRVAEGVLKYLTRAKKALEVDGDADAAQDLLHGSLMPSLQRFRLVVEEVGPSSAPGGPSKLLGDEASARFYHSATLENGTLYVFGGLKRDRPTRLCPPEVLVLAVEDVEDWSRPPWTRLETSGVEAPPLCWHTCVMLPVADGKRRLYVFGGKGPKNRMSNAGYILDLHRNVWYHAPSGDVMPAARGGHTFNRVPGTNEYVLFGGMNYSGTQCFNDLFVFNGVTLEWREVACAGDVPQSRFVHASAVMGGKLWIYGGLRGTLSRSAPCTDLWALDLATMRWEQPPHTGTRPERGTYSMIALPGALDEPSYSVLVLGSKAFDDTRSSYHVFQVGAAGAVEWARYDFKAESPSVSEGVALVKTALHDVLMVGGRPGDPACAHLDVYRFPTEELPIARSQLSLEIEVGELKTSPTKAAAPISPRPGGKRRTSRRSSEALGSSSAIEREPLPKERHEKRSNIVPRRASSSKRGTASLSRASTLRSGTVASTAEGETHRLNLQQNYEEELSRRLEAESKAHALARDLEFTKAQFEALKEETTNLFHLALSELKAPKQREGLTRRYEEIRESLFSSTVAPVTAPETQSGGGYTDFLDKIRHVATTSSSRRKEALYSQHKQMVERVNELNEDYRMEDARPAPPKPRKLRDLWPNLALAMEFMDFIQEEEPETAAGNMALFCHSVSRYRRCAAGNRLTLAQDIVFEHLQEGATKPLLARNARQELARQVGQMVQDASSNPALFDDAAATLEAQLGRLYRQFVTSSLNGGARAVGGLRASGSFRLSARARTNTHRLVATASEQMAQKLQQLGNESSADNARWLNVTKELVATERNYVVDLKIVCTLFRQPLLETDSPIAPLDAFRLFGNVEDLYEANMRFLTALEKEHAKPLEQLNYGAVILEAIAEWQRLYLAFCGHQTTSRTAVDRLVATNKKFVAFLEECNRKPATRMLSLKSFLIKPVQRICKYPLFLRDLVANCPPGYKHKAALQAAAARMQKLVGKIEGQLFEEDDKMRILELESSWNWHRDPQLQLVKGDRRLWRDGLVCGGPLLPGSNEPDPKNTRDVHLYLFSDVLVVAGLTESKKGAPKHIMLQAVPLLFCAIADMVGRNAFTLVQPQADWKYGFFCTSHTEKIGWLKAFLDTSMACRAKQREAEKFKL